jgi:hypothetical protein
MLEHPRAWPGNDATSPKVARNSPAPTQSVPVAAGSDFTGNPLRGLYVGSAGTLELQLLEDNQLHQYNLPAGRFDGVIIKVGTGTAGGLMGFR